MGVIRNPVSFSKHFGVDEGRLAKLGVFDPILNVDTRLFIDPVLVSKSGHRGFAKSATATFRRYFSEIIKLLGASRIKNDVAWREARRRLALLEATGTCLGYGAGSIRGRAADGDLTERLTATGKEVTLVFP
jgi:hypothetical protein